MAFLPGLDKETKTEIKTETIKTSCYKCKCEKLETYNASETLMYRCLACGTAWPGGGLTSVLSMNTYEQDQFIKECEQVANETLLEDY